MYELIEKSLNSKKIRYEYLEILFSKYKNSFKPENTINIFIDLPSMVKQLYNPENIKGISGIINKKEKYFIASNLLNMIAHYRHFFASRLQCYTNIAFIYNSKIDTTIQKINPNYKKTYYEKRFLFSNPIFSDLNCLLRDNYKIIKIMIDYLPHCYFLDSLSMDSSCIFPFIIEQDEFKDNLNIIISNDKLLYQNTLVGETLILQPKGDKSNIITSNYIFNDLVGKNKTIEKNPNYLLINPENILLIESLINHKNNDTIGIRNYGYMKALEFLNKNNIDLNKITISLDIVDVLFKELLSEEELLIVKDNFKIYNSFYLSSLYEERLNNLYPIFTKYINDTSELKKVNETFFAKYPLLLDFLFEGE